MIAGANPSKTAILSSIRDHLRQSLAFEKQHSEHPAQPGSNDLVDPIEIEPDVVIRFIQALESVGGKCLVVENLEQAAAAIDKIVAEPVRIATSNSALVSKILQLLKDPSRIAINPTKADLFQYDVGISGAQWGIAETGTLVLESDVETHRLVSLVPPCHIVILQRDSIVHSMSEVFEAIGKQVTTGLSPTITFITGPSRTSDIELTLAIGVHGPAELYVIIIDEVRNG